MAEKRKKQKEMLLTLYADEEFMCNVYAIFLINSLSLHRYDNVGVFFVTSGKVVSSSDVVFGLKVVVKRRVESKRRLVVEVLGESGIFLPPHFIHH